MDLAAKAFAPLVGEPASDPYARAAHRERVMESCKLMEEKVSESLTLCRLSRRVGISAFHFSRLFAEFTGRSPHRYLIHLRLNLAARLLRDGLSVTEACYGSGFSHPSHFARSFRRRFDALPSEYRESRKFRKKVLAGSLPV